MLSRIKKLLIPENAFVALCALALFGFLIYKNFSFGWLSNTWVQEENPVANDKHQVVEVGSFDPINRTPEAITLNSTVSKIEFSESIPLDATWLSFNFMFTDLGAGDWLTLDWNGQMLFTFSDTHWVGADYFEEWSRLDKFRGQEGTFRFILHDNGSGDNAQVRLKDFKYLATTTLASHE